jgi:hypothetical protein
MINITTLIQDPIHIKFKETNGLNDKKLISMLFIKIKHLIEDINGNNIELEEITKNEFEDILRVCKNTMTKKKLFLYF